MTSHRSRRSRWLTPIFGLVALLVAEPAWGADPGPLENLGLCELEQLFAQGEARPLPVGFGRGRVLYLANTKRPRVKAHLNNAVWKGKVFRADGSFVNQWAGFQALESMPGYQGPSWFDGKPCIVTEYPAGTPLFANTRDELRQIGPNLYLARFYDRCPCPKFRGFFVLRFPTCECCNPR